MKKNLCCGDSNTYGAMPVNLSFLDNSFHTHEFRFPREKDEPIYSKMG
jgi:hypothetical protein